MFRRDRRWRQHYHLCKICEREWSREPDIFFRILGKQLDWPYVVALSHDIPHDSAGHRRRVLTWFVLAAVALSGWIAHHISPGRIGSLRGWEEVRKID